MNIGFQVGPEDPVNRRCFWDVFSPHMKNSSEPFHLLVDPTRTRCAVRRHGTDVCVGLNWDVKGGGNPEGTQRDFSDRIEKTHIPLKACD